MTEHRLALVVGATRGIGLGVTKEFLRRGWDVIATARDPAKATALQDLAAAHPGRVSVPRLDMNDPAALNGFPETLGPKCWTPSSSMPASPDLNIAALTPPRQRRSGS